MQCYCTLSVSQFAKKGNQNTVIYAISTNLRWYLAFEWKVLAKVRNIFDQDSYVTSKVFLCLIRDRKPVVNILKMGYVNKICQENYHLCSSFEKITYTNAICAHVQEYDLVHINFYEYTSSADEKPMRVVN